VRLRAAGRRRPADHGERARVQPVAERQERGERRRAHPGPGLHALEHAVERRRHLPGRRVVGARQRELRRQHLLRAEARVGRREAREAAGEQPGAQGQCEGERHLCDHRAAQHPVPLGPDRRAARRPAQRGLRVGAHGAQRRRQPERERRARGHAQRADEHPRVDPHLGELRVLRRVPAPERRHGPRRERDAQHPARRGEHRALRPERPHQACAPRAHRRPHRQLAGAPGRAHELQTGHVGARHQQDERDGAQQHARHRPQLARQHLRQGRGPEHDPPVLRAARPPELLAPPRRLLGEARRQPLRADARAHARHGDHRPAPPLLLHVGVRGRRKVQVDAAWVPERRPGDADHLERDAVEADGPAHHARVAAEVLAPEAVAEHRHAGRAGRARRLGLVEPAGRRARLHDPEELALGARGAHAQGLAVGRGEVAAPRLVGGAAVEQVAPREHVLGGGRAEVGAGDAERRGVLAHHHQAAQGAHRQRAEQHGVGDGQHGGRRAHA
jgi:hypothetical protein